MEKNEVNIDERHLTWFDSPKHSYLKVTRNDLIELDVWQNKTDSSYGGQDYAYLEKDSDAKTFIEAAEEEGWELSFERVEVPDFPSAEFTGEEIKPLEEDPRCYWCRESREKYCECEFPECPICGDVAVTGDEMSLEHFCGHLLAGWDDGGYTYSILEIEKGISNETVNGYDWTEKELETAFGEALPLYNCFEDGYGDVESAEFWDVLAELIPEIKSGSFYDTPAGARFGWGATMYCAEDPDKVKVQAEALLQKLKEGYEQLAKSLPEK